jgi:hypothetical protein
MFSAIIAAKISLMVAAAVPAPAHRAPTLTADASVLMVMPEMVVTGERPSQGHASAKVWVCGAYRALETDSTQMVKPCEWVARGNEPKGF